MRQYRKMCLALLLIGSAMIVGCGVDAKREPDSTTHVELPTVNSSKHPSQYTWEEYLAMDEEQKLAFQKSFGSVEFFEAWKQMAQRDESEDEPGFPWEQGGKKPSEYTWAEFEALTGEEQMAFQNWFENLEAFDAWLQDAQHQAITEEVELPWENGGKKPSQYTWEEFEDLSAAQQMFFQNWFETLADFDVWLQKAQHGAISQELVIPWENGGKAPADYTWEEFEALSAELQMAFQNSFESIEAFDAWLQKAQGGEGVSDSVMPWEQGGKKPSQYTWAEFEALTAEQQMAFQNWFANLDAFDAWLQEAQSQESDTQSKMPWEQGGKKPSEYTWAEFEALTGEQQMAFQSWFESIEDFDAWMQRANP